MEFVYNDGGRSKYFKEKNVGDCVTRAIAIATGKDYLEIYNDINELAKRERTGKRKKKISNARSGVYKQTDRKYLESLGWKWIPCSKIGVGCTMHLNENELPQGTIICQVTKHLVCVKDGVIYDTYNSSIKYDKDGNLVDRCVYGYFVKEG